MRDFLRALSFLTILPVGRFELSEERGLARSMAFYSFAGLVVGLLLVLGYHLFLFLLPRPIGLWLTIGWLAFLTRGLHLDGFADTIDGIGAGGTREKMLEVMRDSRIGAFGVIGLILLLGGKYLALSHLSDPFLPYGLLLMSVTARNSMVLVCYRSPYARSEGGLARPFTENLGSREIVFSSVSALGIAFFFPGFKGLVAFLGVGLFSLLLRFYFIRRLGGVTGDILGAANESAEVVCLILLVILERAGMG